MRAHIPALAAFALAGTASVGAAQVTNAPVAPDTIYLGRRATADTGQGLSVIDLNGFGAGTGNPDYDPLQPIKEGNSNYPNNPNLLQSNLMIPPLATHGTSTLDGGSAGVFTLTKNSALDDLLLALSTKAPVVYVETEYFGGVGTQAASAYEGGRLRSRESSEDPGPISRALAGLGVEKGDQYDEFDALGLGRHRHTEDWKQEADGS